MSGLLRALPAALLGLLALLVWAVFAFVDLTPHVDERFFFAPNSPIYREAHDIDVRFRTRALLCITAYTDDIDRPGYLQRVARLTHKLQRSPYVISVKSLADGPKDLKDARASPLWRRLLLLKDVQASNLVLVVDDRHPRQLIDSVTRVMRGMDTENFRLRLTGIPYVVDSISVNLQHDFKLFSAIALAMFAALLLVMFRSLGVLVGALAACIFAAAGTLLVQQLVGGRIGLLTANIVTITGVLTQSHIVFMTNNWRNVRNECDTPRQAAWLALKRTSKASFWCMAAALLGFMSLLTVDAQPLRELGYGGTIATLCAIFSAYVIYPPFLLWTRVAREGAKRRPPLLRRLGFPNFAVSVALLAAALAVGFGATRLDTDPTLMQYFDAESAVRRNLEAVDPHGGTSPLDLVVRRKDHARLDTADSYKKLWGLQEALQKDPAVGTVVSLPVLMAEANRSPLAFFLTWKWLIDLLEKPQFGRVADGFVTNHRTEALFMLRMNETDRDARRTAIIERLEADIRQHGFETTEVGGIYALQGRLADLVLESLKQALAGLLLALGIIAVIITRSFAAGVMMAACAATVPSVALGLFGFFNVPLDIVATPAVNVAIGVAVDSMIHLGAAWRRLRRRLPNKEALQEAQHDQAVGMGAFFVVVAAGFTIFALSSFPPTQRFGWAVVIGATVAGAMALWVFPGLLSILKRRDEMDALPGLSPSVGAAAVRPDEPVETRDPAAREAGEDDAASRD